jgi:hypothetical protein
MPRIRAVWLVSGFLALAALASSARATPIGPSCGTCQGSIYDLSYSGSPIASDPTPLPNAPSGTETFRITYTIDTAGYAGGGSYLDTVALKVASSFLDASLVSAPGGVAVWAEMSGGLNAAGCSGSGSGYDCVRWATTQTLAPAVPGGPYVWVFDVTVPTGTLFTGANESSVKARYVNGLGRKVGDLVSENITLSVTTVVPEPGTAVLVATALLGLAARGRRRP